MKIHLLLFTLLCSLAAFAQNENNIWHFGRGCSMYFEDGKLVKTTATPGVQPHKFSDFIYKTAAVSDKQTGQLLFYTNGRQVMNKNHLPMPNGNLGGAMYHLVIVPNLLDTTQYFIFYTAPSFMLMYALVDMKLNSGLGDVVYHSRMLSNKAYIRFVVVKQFYGQGHWLISQGWNDNTFYAYRITGNTVSGPVTSKAGPDRWFDSYDNTAGEMEATTDGNMFACTFKDPGNEGAAGIYHFDKKCGTVTFGQMFKVNRYYQSLAFDHTSQFLYVSQMTMGGNYELWQYDLFTADPGLSASLVGAQDGYSPIESMELAPDNRIYITTEEQSPGPSGGLSPAPTLHVVERPWQKGTTCGFVPKNIKLNSGALCSGLPCQITNSLPDGVSDRTFVEPGFEKPVERVKSFCAGDQTEFAIINDFGADSVKWIFGDGDSAYGKNVSHRYTAGNYTAHFKWYLCGFEYVKEIKVAIGDRPVISLGKDTTLCNGTTLELSGPVADQYQWSTGDTGRSIVVKTPGIYQLWARNGDCSTQDEVKVEYYQPLWIALGDEYFICDDEQELTRLDAGEGFRNYKWTPTGDTTQWIEVADLGEYFVVVKDFRGCNGNDGTKVKRRCPVKVYFPNAFTPNGDGINDVFVPIGKDVTKFTMTVYNRWGQEVFTTDNLSVTWDGTTHNKYAPADVYFYKSYYEGYRNKRITGFEAKGNVTLLR